MGRSCDHPGRPCPALEAARRPRKLCMPRQEAVPGSVHPRMISLRLSSSHLSSWDASSVAADLALASPSEDLELPVQEPLAADGTCGSQVSRERRLQRAHPNSAAHSTTSLPARPGTPLTINLLEAEACPVHCAHSPSKDRCTLDTPSPAAHPSCTHTPASPIPPPASLHTAAVHPGCPTQTCGASSPSWTRHHWGRLRPRPLARCPMAGTPGYVWAHRAPP